MFRHFIVSSLIAILLTGCAAYHAPGRGANLPEALGVAASTTAVPGDIAAHFNKKPLAQFPAGVAVVRIQAPGYASATTTGWGSGNYSVVLARDVESDDAMERVRKLPQLRGIAPIGKLLLPSNLNSDKELRNAAASLQADMLLVYTFDTAFHDRDLASPISIITLGLAPTQATHVTTTASAVLMDTRSGFIFGTAESSVRKSGLATAWNTRSAIDGDRQKCEREAFDKLTGEIETMWKGVVTEFGPNAPRGGKYPTGG